MKNLIIATISCPTHFIRWTVDETGGVLASAPIESPGEPILTAIAARPERATVLAGCIYIWLAALAIRASCLEGSQTNLSVNRRGADILQMFLDISIQDIRVTLEAFGPDFTRLIAHVVLPFFNDPDLLDGLPTPDESLKLLRSLSEIDAMIAKVTAMDELIIQHQSAKKDTGCL